MSLSTEPRQTVPLAVTDIVLYFALYAAQFFLPQSISRRSREASILEIGSVGPGCYVFAVPAMFRWSKHALRQFS
ncbi:hypothetical protein A4G26_17965 [Mycobacterium kansasii]|nr:MULTISPECIES: hypothetical protein [Mycobacterium]KZS55170.1 hypothetical protein A4G26_17965 [Mycobacterium kansasii]